MVTHWPGLLCSPLGVTAPSGSGGYSGQMWTGAAGNMWARAPWERWKLPPVMKPAVQVTASSWPLVRVGLGQQAGPSPQRHPRSACSTSPTTDCGLLFSG